MANTLMFEVGVSMAKDGLAQVKKELDQFVNEYSKKMQIQIEIKNLQTLVDSLRSIGSGDQLKPLLEQIGRMQQRLGAMSDKGQYFDMLHREAAAAAKAVEMAQERLDKVKKTNNVNLISNANQQLQEAQKEAAGVNAALANATARFAEEEKKAAATTTDTKAKIDALAQSVADLHTKMGGNMKVDLGGDFKKWATEAQAVTTSVKELVEQLQKMHTATATAANSGTTNGGIFDQQKFTSLQEAIDKIIREINRLQEAFTKLGENSSLSNLSATINGLAVTLGTFGDRIKLMPVDEQVKALMERLDKAETKLREVADAARYLNEQNGARTRAKSNNIANIAGEGTEKITEAQQRLNDAINAELVARQKVEQTNKQIENSLNRIAQLNTSIAKNESNLPNFIEPGRSNVEELIKKERAEVDSLKQSVETLQKQQIQNQTKLTEAINQRAQAEKAAAEAAENDKLVIQQRTLLNNFQRLKENADSFQKVIANIGEKSGSLGIDTTKINLAKEAIAGLIAQYEKFDTAKLTGTDLAEFRSQLALVKSQFRDLINEYNQFNKTTDRGSSQAESRIRKLGMAFNDLKNYMRQNGGSEEMRKLQAEIQGAIQKMRQLMNAGNFAGAVNVYERMAGSLRQAATATKEFENSQHSLSSTINHTNGNLQGQSQILSDLKSMATQYLGVWGAQGFLRNIIQIGGQLEMQRLSIGAILGDMAKATELFDRIKNLAIKSPFGVVELDQMTKQLSAYGFEYNELFDMTKRLADISAATGTGVDRLALALGHVRSEAALSGYTLRQFSMANIPLAKKLSEELTKVEGKFVSVADVRKRVRTKDIGYEQVLKVLKDLTDEGGMFYNAQEIMSQSVKARFKNLKDSMDIMYGEIAESSVGKGLKEVASLLTTLTRHWQELGAVLVVGAGYWSINRVAMMAASKAAATSNLITGQFTAKQLEAQAASGNLTRQQLLQAMATKKLSAADAEAAANTLGLARAQLIHARNTGNVTAALNMATIATSRYSISQLRMMAMFRNLSLFNLKDLFFGIVGGAKAAAVAIGGMLKALWPMLALSAVAEIIMSIKRESEQFADAANYVGQAARNMMKDIDEAINSVSKNGKPLDTESLREAVNTMKEVLENSEFYTAEQQKQVDNAKTLSEKYDILLRQMKELKEEAEWQTNNEGLINTILANTGRNVRVNTVQNWNNQTGKYETVTSQTFGSRFFNDSLQENIEQVNKSNASLQSAISLLAEYQNVIEDAIKKNNNFGLSLDGKTWQEQVRLIAESGKWDEFVASVENAGSRFEGTASKVKEASEKVRDDWEEIVNDDVKAIRLTLMKEWGMTEDEITQFAKNNERTMRWLVDAIAKSLSKLGVAEAIIDEFKQKLLELFGVASGGKPSKREPTEYEKQTDLAKRVLGNVIRHNKDNGRNGQGVTTVKEINEIVGTGEHVKTESEVVKALRERAQKDHEAMKDVKRIYGETSKEYKKAKEKYEHSLNLAESNGINESEILTGKYKDKGVKKGDDDKDAKILRERVRILKEAADSYQYWRTKVGESAAETHMQDEFGLLLTEQNLQLKNADELKSKLKSLRDEYSKKPQTKAMVEAIKEIDKEIAQLDRKDFERETEKFLSETQLELDNLTRSWETFNKVRDATGDIDLAIQLSGAEYENGQMRNLADAVKAKIERDFASAGAVAIPFDMSFDNEKIKTEVEKAFADVAPKREDFDSEEAYTEALLKHEARIKSIVTETQKWRDLQNEVIKNDTDVFLKNWNDEYDRKQQLDKVIAQYEASKQSLDNLLSQWMNGAVDENGKRLGITQEQYNQAFGKLNSNTNWSKFKADNNFKLKLDFIDGANVEMIRKMIQAMRDYAATAAMDAQETKEWLELMDKLTDKETVLDPLTSIVDIVGLYKDAVTGRKAAEKALQIAQMTPEERKKNGINESTVLPIDKAQEAYLLALNKEKKALNEATKAISSFGSSLSNLGSAMTSFGNAIGGDFGAVVGGFGSMIGTFGSSMQTISQMQKVEGIAGTIGQISGVLSIASAGIEMNKQLAEVLPYTENLYERYAEKQKEINKMTEAINQYSQAVTEARWNEHGWISDDPLAELSKQYEIHGDAAYAYYSKLNEAQEKYVEKSGTLAKSVLPVLGAIGGTIAGIALTIGTYGTATVAGAAIAGAAIGAATGQGKQAEIDAKMYRENLVTARENLKALTQHKSFWRGEKTQNLEEWVRENIKDRYGRTAELFDEQGLINLETAQAVLDSGQRLAGETEDTLKKLMELRKDYDEWEQSVEEYVSSKFSPLADNMVDAIWDWLAEGKDALDQFHEYASKTFMDIAKDAVKSFLKITVLDKYEDQLKELYKRYSSTDGNGNRLMSENELMGNVAEIAGNMAATLEAMLPAAEELGKTITEAFGAYGYDVVNSSSTSGVSSSIKSVTEQTADLLASYINACRADVSVNRAMIAQYFPMYLSALTTGNDNLRNISTHTQAIMKSNDEINRNLSAFYRDFEGLKNKAWKMPVA